MQRSMAEFQTAVELVRNGRIGKLKQVVGRAGRTIRQRRALRQTAGPAALDWDLFQGQAARRTTIARNGPS